MGTERRYDWTEAQKQRMAKLYADEWSLEDIATKMGCTRETVRYHLRRRGVALRGRGMQTAKARAKYSGPRHHGWKGGRFLDHGYVALLRRDHPHADQDGYVREHRYVVERHLLRTQPDHPALERGVLSKAWVVHHKNGVKDDNRLNNLEVLPRGQHHSWMHYQDEMERLRTILRENGIEP